MTVLVPSIPSDLLHIIPSLIPETVLGTKEPSEKTRTAAFNLVVAMGKKMSQGGVVKRSLVDGMDEDAPEAADGMSTFPQNLYGRTDHFSLSVVTANIEEFMTMMAGGLAGASPHMISATVTAISRLIFEFKGSAYSYPANHISYCRGE
jgi:ribosomal RNA-processing protein 12